jgi:hypothetical protein
MEQETRFQKTPRNGGQAGTGGLPRPLRHFADRLDELRSADVTDMDQVGRLLVELAADEEFFGPLIRRSLPAHPAANG